MTSNYECHHSCIASGTVDKAASMLIPNYPCFSSLIELFNKESSQKCLGKMICRLIRELI